MKPNHRNHLENNLFNTNPFSNVFTQFEEEAFYEAIHNKVKNQSYYQKYKGFKNTILAASYLFNAASILSASYAIFWITAWITGITWIGYVLAGVFLFFLEKLKRKSSNEFFQYYFFRNKMAYGWLSLSFFCLVISLVASSFGTKEGVENLSPDPNLVAADSLATLYRGEIEQLKEENSKLSLQKDHTGTIYYRLQSVIKANKLMISDYNSRIIELDKKLENHNAELSEEYKKDVKATAWIMVFTIILMEIFFECCLAYVWYFNFRTYVEHKKTQKSNSLNNDLSISNANQTSANNHFIPPPQQSKSDSRKTKPIGFDLSSKKAASNESIINNVKSPVQACTEPKNDSLIDIHTVEHQYYKNGDWILVHYTHAQILARINQYKRGVNEALKKDLGKEILDNRKKWLTYWLGKEKELTLKRKNVITS